MHNQFNLDFYYAQASKEDTDIFLKILSLDSL